MKLKALLILMISANVLFAQTFKEALPFPSFEGVNEAVIAFSDVDGDNDEDVFITGLNELKKSIAKLYINDGSGQFMAMKNTPFVGVANGAAAFSDVDGDNDEDLLITGQRMAKLYINDGTGHFSEAEGASFEGVEYCSVAFADVDEDKDNDLLITGRNGSKQPIAKLYINDGAGKFSEMEGTPFEGVSFGAVAFADVDGDNDVDLFITGRNSAKQAIAKLYINE